MDDALSEQRLRDYARSYAAFRDLVEFVRSDPAQAMTMQELEAAVEPGFQALVAALVTDAESTRARRRRRGRAAVERSDSGGGADA